MRINDMIMKVHEEEFRQNTNGVSKGNLQDANIEKNQKREMDPEKLVKKLNETADINKKGIKFEKLDQLNDWIVKVVDKKSGEVIRQIPSEEVVRISKTINEMLGNIYDHKG